MLLVIGVSVTALMAYSSFGQQQQSAASKPADDAAKGEIIRPAKLAILSYSSAGLTNSPPFGLDLIAIGAPKTNLVEAALNGLPVYLSSFKGLHKDSMYAEKCLPALRNLTNSYCQAVRVTYKGQAGVLLNFLPGDRPEWTIGWQDHWIKVHDGGPRYWQVVYLETEKTFTRLHFDLGY